MQWKREKTPAFIKKSGMGSGRYAYGSGTPFPSGASKSIFDYRWTPSDSRFLVIENFPTANDA